MTINYEFEGNDFEYEVPLRIVKHELYQYLLDNWTSEELLDLIFDWDNDTVDLCEYFEDYIKEIFESEAEEYYYEQD